MVDRGTIRIRMRMRKSLKLGRPLLIKVVATSIGSGLPMTDPKP